MGLAINVEELSKRFILGEAHRESMLREHLSKLLRSAFRRPAVNNTFWALRDVSFRVDQGEVIGIIGSNGAGKSTLLKILSRITYPTSGRVSTHGRVSSLLEVGTGFHEELTGRENLFLNGSILGMRRAEVQAKLDAIVSYAGVERFIDTPIKRYSSGMRLRLGFAVAAHLEPDILIVDEVLAVGDAGFQKKCLNTLDGLRSGGRTVLFVSHNMAAVENLCTRTLWLDAGSVRMDGSTHAVIEAYMGTFAGVRAASVDLRQASARRGTGQVLLTGLDFLAPDGQPRAITRSGDPLTLRLHYAANTPSSNLSFGYRLTTELGTLVTEVGTWHHDIELPRIPTGDGYIDLIIPALNLMPGRYYLTAAVSGTVGQVHDYLENCALLEIGEANIYGSGRILDGRHGIVFFPQHWGLEGVRSMDSPQGDAGS